MISTHDFFNRPGGDPLPIQRRGTGNGVPDVRIIGSTGDTLPFGTIVMAGQDEGFADFNAGAVAGPTSSMQNAELPRLPARYALTGLFGVITEKDGVRVGERTRVEAGRSALEARVQMPAADGLYNGQPLMPDFAGVPGTLIPWDGTAKAVALTARAEIGGPGIDGTEQLIFVRFDGSHGWT